MSRYTCYFVIIIVPVIVYVYTALSLCCTTLVLFLLVSVDEEARGYNDGRLELILEV